MNHTLVFLSVTGKGGHGDLHVPGEEGRLLMAAYLQKPRVFPNIGIPGFHPRGRSVLTEATEPPLSRTRRPTEGGETFGLHGTRLLLGASSVLT